VDVLALKNGSVSFFAPARRVGALVEELQLLAESGMPQDAGLPGVPMTPAMLQDYALGAFHMLQVHHLEPDDDLRTVAGALDRLTALHPMLRTVHVPPAFWVRERASYPLDEMTVPDHDVACARDLTSLPIDLAHNVFRARLYRVDGRGAAFLGLSIHHLVLDGPSQQVCLGLRAPFSSSLPLCLPFLPFRLCIAC
jgi:hypothetical protein